MLSILIANLATLAVGVVALQIGSTGLVYAFGPWLLRLPEIQRRVGTMIVLAVGYAIGAMVALAIGAVLLDTNGQIESYPWHVVSMGVSAAASVRKALSIPGAAAVFGLDVVLWQ